MDGDCRAQLSEEMAATPKPDFLGLVQTSQQVKYRQESR